ncbi:MAG: DUF3566 domain-containing protein [Actinobacteria bacterium]|nr:DUF3566 domain-containing protein [Actinomycetota bacterium]
MARRRLTLKRIDPWSVLKFGFVVNLALLAIFLLGFGTVWFFIQRLGLIDKACSIAEDLGFQNCGVNGGNLFRLMLLLGLLGTIIQTGLLVFFAFLHNLIADLTGGLGFTFVDESPAAPAKSAPARSGYVSPPAQPTAATPAAAARPAPERPPAERTDALDRPATPAPPPPEKRPEPVGERSGGAAQTPSNPASSPPSSPPAERPPERPAPEPAGTSPGLFGTQTAPGGGGSAGSGGAPSGPPRPVDPSRRSSNSAWGSDSDDKGGSR